MANSPIDRSAPLAEPLTHREREILAYLAGDLYSHEIAEALTLSPNSVKWHTRQIYAKLGVNSRKEAIARARELDLLEYKTGPVLYSHSLPAAMTPFVGRQNELEQIRQLLADPSFHLLTLIGAGGVGKTRLALRVAHELQESYPQGACLVELAALSEPGFVPQTVAAAFDLHPYRDRFILNVIVNCLRNKKLLLVLDNCEHLVAACASLVNLLLQACPDLHILATSREVLGIEGERTYLVPSLSFPEPGEKYPPEELIKYEAVDLFTRRARAVLPDFELNEANASTVAGICRHLDGIPLALELAAAHLRVMDVEQIAGQLENRFRLLRGGDRTALPRLQTMHASIDWSYQLLLEAEKILLRRLSVFAGGWSLAAARAVCADDTLPEADILDVLGGLVNKSLVLVIRGRGRELRYHLLETVRQYAREKFSELGEVGTIRDQHLAYFLSLAGRAETELVGAEQCAWFDRLELEHGNLRAALGWSLESAAAGPEAGLRMADNLWWFWSMRGYYEEEEKWLKKTLTLSASQTSADLVTRAKALAKLGFCECNQVRLEEALALGRSLGPAGSESVALALWGLGAATYYTADYARAKSLEEQSLQLFRELRHRWGICESLAWLGKTMTELGDYQQATVLLEESLELARKARDGNEIGNVLCNLGLVALARGNYDQATTLFKESQASYHEIKAFFTFADLLLGDAAFQKGDVRLAEFHYKEGLALYWERGIAYFIARGLERLAHVAAVRKQPERAARLLGAAEALRESRGIGIYPYERQEYESHLESLRLQLDQVTWTALWAEGRAMTLEVAVAFALND